MTMETAVIAGVGPGLGSSLARAFAREGYTVALISRRSQSSEPVAEQIRSAGGKAIIIPADVTQRQAVLKSVERASAELGPITALAYNASGYGRGAFLEIEQEQIRQSFDVGVMGAVHVSQASIPPLLKSGHGAMS